MNIPKKSPEIECPETEVRVSDVENVIDKLAASFGHVVLHSEDLRQPKIVVAKLQEII